MPDLRTVLRNLATRRAVHNAGAELAEHARIHAEIDALAQRLSGRPANHLPKERSAS